jgi:hypothetical protein
VHKIPPIYQVIIKELTSKQTIISTLHQGELAPLLREGSMLAAVEETDRRLFWRVTPLKQRRNEYV